MVALPALTPVTTPSGLTVATAVSLDSKVSFAALGLFFTARSNVAPVFTSAASFVNFSPALMTVALAERVFFTAFFPFLAVTLTLFYTGKSGQCGRKPLKIQGV